MEARVNAERARIERAHSLLLPIHVSLAHSICSPVGTFLAVFVTFFPLVLCVHRITASSHCGRNCNLRFYCIADTMSVSFAFINYVYFYFFFRVLLERLIVNRPHPWGLLITFIELIKNHQYKFWTHEFVHCAPEIEK